MKLYHEMTLGSIIIAMETRPLEKLVMLQSYIEFLNAKNLTISGVFCNNNSTIPTIYEYFDFFTTLMFITKPRFYFI